MQRRVVMEQRVWEEEPQRNTNPLVGIICALVLVVVLVVLAIVAAPFVIAGVVIMAVAGFAVGAVRFIYAHFCSWRSEQRLEHERREQRAHELRVIEAQAKAAQQQPQPVYIYVNSREEARQAQQLLQQRGQIAQIEAQTSNPDYIDLRDYQTKATHLHY